MKDLITRRRFLPLLCALLVGLDLVSLGVLAPSAHAAEPAVAASSSVRPASVLSCPGYSTARLASTVGVAAVNIGGCPGYWVVNSSGQVDSYGSAVYHGGLASTAFRIVGITATSDGGGYWLVGANGAVHPFGDARFLGDASTFHLAGPVLGMSITQDGKGYWLVASDGGIFSFGDAHFYGSMGGKHLNEPVDGMAVAPGGAGYWLVAQDGGVFTFTGDGFYGSMGGKHLNKPVIGMSGTPDGRGYTLVASDGGVFNFGDSPFYGSLGGSPPASPVMDLSPVHSNTGYYLVDGVGQVFAFGPGTAIPAKLTLSVPAIPAATVGRPYDVAFRATGGRAPYHWSSSGSLPPGIHLTSAGALAGTPTLSGTFSLNVTVSDSGSPVQSVTTTVAIHVTEPAALQVATTQLPTPIDGSPYHAALQATGGIAPYTWAPIAGALPPELSLASSGQITGTPTASAGAFTFTVQVKDAAGTTASASLTLIAALGSYNWSGYAAAGGPFIGVQGAFTVPSLTAATTANEHFAEWVGIDGIDNPDLIQAGVALDPDPSAPGSRFTVTPWWEILPAFETPITTMTVNPGDRVGVAIDQISGTSEWSINVTDETNGQSFTTEQAYSGPGDSAEWIVEAPTIVRNGLSTTSSIAPYSPAVAFSDLAISQQESGIARFVLLDPNISTNPQTSTPSDIDSNGFNVAYGSKPPAAP